MKVNPKTHQDVSVKVGSADNKEEKITLKVSIEAIKGSKASIPKHVLKAITFVAREIGKASLTVFEKISAAVDKVANHFFKGLAKLAGNVHESVFHVKAKATEKEAKIASLTQEISQIEAKMAPNKEKAKLYMDVRQKQLSLNLQISRGDVGHNVSHFEKRMDNLNKLLHYGSDNSKGDKDITQKEFDDAIHLIQSHGRKTPITFVTPNNASQVFKNPKQANTVLMSEAEYKDYSKLQSHLDKMQRQLEKLKPHAQ